jgi:hypothetical protein
MKLIESVDSLDVDFFTKLLLDRCDQSEPSTTPVSKIESLSIERVDQGVLSQVYRVHLTYSDNRDFSNEPSSPTSDWIVKLVRKDLNLHWMCQNETSFFSQYAPILFDIDNNDGTGRSYGHNSTTAAAATTTLPFAIPKFLAGSDHYIILQEILDVQTFPLDEGCPPEKVDFLLQALAGWHAKCWDASCFFTYSNTIRDDLASPSGMGQRLPPLQKEGLFITSWQSTVEHTFVGSPQGVEAKLAKFAINLCEQLAVLRLRDIHDMVHRHRVTCIHGDYHIANWLFPSDDDGSSASGVNSTPVLIDWATAGYGNPMVDLVFFLVVSTNDQIASEAFQVWLPKYWTALMERLSPNDLFPTAPSLETVKEWFQWALLCQWLILVAYDDVCRSIASQGTDEASRDRQLRHFRNVNRRAIMAMNSVGNWDETLSKLTRTTAAERDEAEQFCRNNSLTI